MAKTDWLLERRDFPAFGRGLSLRLWWSAGLFLALARNFPAFGRGLSLRQGLAVLGVAAEGHFPAFGRELSLRRPMHLGLTPWWERISLPSGGDFH